MMENIISRYSRTPMILQKVENEWNMIQRHNNQLRMRKMRNKNEHIVTQAGMKEKKK